MNATTHIIAQDDTAIMKSVMHVLLEEGFQVYVAVNPFEGYAKDGEMEADHNTPVFDALGVLRFVRSECSRVNPVVIMVAGMLGNVSRKMDNEVAARYLTAA